MAGAPRWHLNLHATPARAIGLGHTDWVRSVAWSPDGRRALSGSNDKTVRLWDVETGRGQRVFEGHSGSVWSVTLSGNGRTAYSGAINGVLRIWDLSEAGVAASEEPATYSQYTNAKVLLVGESHSGKTALSSRLMTGKWIPSEASTVGAWATQLKLGSALTDGLEREIWLWDFGGQADQRLIHIGWIRHFRRIS